MAKVRHAALLTIAAFAAWNSLGPRAETPLATPVAESRSALEPGLREGVTSVPSKESVAGVPSDQPLVWNSLRERIRALEPTDQPGLDRLYQDAAEKIRADEPEALRGIADSYRSLLGSRLEEGFFVVAAWMRSSRAPSQVLRVIWSQAPKGAEAEPSGGHLGQQTPGDRHGRIEAFALRELRKLVKVGRVDLEPGEKSALVAEVATRAANVRSLNVGLEAFQLLSALQAGPAIESALGKRPENERQLIRQVLDPNT